MCQLKTAVFCLFMISIAATISPLSIKKRQSNTLDYYTKDGSNLHIIVNVNEGDNNEDIQDYQHYINDENHLHDEDHQDIHDSIDVQDNIDPQDIEGLQDNQENEDLEDIQENIDNENIDDQDIQENIDYHHNIDEHDYQDNEDNQDIKDYTNDQDNEEDNITGQDNEEDIINDQDYEDNINNQENLDNQESTNDQFDNDDFTNSRDYNNINDNDYDEDYDSNINSQNEADFVHNDNGVELEIPVDRIQVIIYLNKILSEPDYNKLISTYLFDLTDTDKDGKLSLSEFLTSFSKLENLGFPLPKTYLDSESISRIFSEIDVNLSKDIDAEEFKNGMNQVIKKVKDSVKKDQCQAYADIIAVDKQSPPNASNTDDLVNDIINKTDAHDNADYDINDDNDQNDNNNVDTEIKIYKKLKIPKIIKSRPTKYKVRRARAFLKTNKNNNKKMKKNLKQSEKVEASVNTDTTVSTDIPESYIQENYLLNTIKEVKASLYNINGDLLKSVFEEFDTNKDNSISQEEATIGVKNYLTLNHLSESINIDLQSISNIMGYDQNLDNKLNIDEFAHFVYSVLTKVFETGISEYCSNNSIKDILNKAEPEHNVNNDFNPVDIEENINNDIHSFDDVNYNTDAADIPDNNDHQENEIFSDDAGNIYATKEERDANAEFYTNTTTQGDLNGEVKESNLPNLSVDNQNAENFEIQGEEKLLENDIGSPEGSKPPQEKSNNLDGSISAAGSTYI